MKWLRGKPDHLQRLEIWKLYTQTGVPVAPEIDWEKIAMKFALTGGYIKCFGTDFQPSLRLFSCIFHPFPIVFRHFLWRFEAFRGVFLESARNAIVSALLLAISRNNVEPQVTEEDITGGCIMQVRMSL